MENPGNTTQTDHLSDRLKTMPILEALRVPAEPLKLQRPLKLFKGALGLHIGVSECPDPEFIVHLLEGASHQQIIRSQVGSQFKNFENFLRGNHATSAKTWKRLLDTLHVEAKSENDFLQLAHGHADGPLLPLYISVAQALEGAFLRTYRTATVGIFICKCCGADKLDDALLWWPEQPIHLARDACSFIDRLLATLVGGTVIAGLLANFDPAKCMDATMLQALSDPEKHPIGNWMAMVRKAKGCKKDWQLLPEPEVDVRLRKWRSGQDLLPMDKALTMIRGTQGEQRLKHGLLAARTLTLAIDVVQAAALSSDRPDRSAAQVMVDTRLRQFLHNVRIGMAERTRRHANAQVMPGGEK